MQNRLAAICGIRVHFNEQNYLITQKLIKKLESHEKLLKTTIKVIDIGK